MNFKSRGSGEERNEKRNVGLGNLDRKRKRIMAAYKRVDGEAIHNTKKKGFIIKGGKRQMKADSFNGRISRVPPARSMWVSGRKNAVRSRTTHPSLDVMNEIETGKSSSRLKEAVQFKRQSRSKFDVSSAYKFDRNKQCLNDGEMETGKFKKQSRSKFDVSSADKTVRNKQNRNDGDTEMNDQPKKHKKKNKIRIDPLDVSNKRLDDRIDSDTASTKERDKEIEREAGISKNAQFRAIQPSPSILSYVEDNLLGRRRLIDLKRAGYNIELSAPLDNIPLSTKSDRERVEENVFRNKLEFFAAAKISSSFPDPDLPEIAFAGRSNVGKSSLLNALTRQWGVARTSDKPGLTQTINFFKLGPKLCLVDLPGYGFAYAKEEVKDAWEDLVKEYVSTRVGLKRVCLLIDTKWGMKPRDYELIRLMERSQTKYQVVLTKTDVVFPIDVARRAMQIEESLKANKSIVQPVMMVSSKTGAGIRSLRTVVSTIARFAKLKI